MTTNKPHGALILRAPVRRVIVNPNYLVNMGYDIALLELSSASTRDSTAAITSRAFSPLRMIRMRVQIPTSSSSS